MFAYVICFEPFVTKVQDDIDIKGIKIPGLKTDLKMSLYADDNTGGGINNILNLQIF